MPSLCFDDLAASVRMATADSHDGETKRCRLARFRWLRRC